MKNKFEFRVTAAERKMLYLVVGAVIIDLVGIICRENLL